MSNGTIDQPVLLVHPTAPSAGRVLRYIFDDTVTKKPYYMSSDGIPHPITPLADHTQLINIGTNTHTQIDTHLSNTNNPHSVSYNQLVGLPTTFRWVLQAGHSNLPSNGNEYGFSYGHNSANDGITALNDGVIEGMSVRVEPTRTAGSASYYVAINNVNNNIAGQRVIVDGAINAEGGINGNSAALTFLTPIPYVKGDQIEVRARTTGWSPTSSDSTVTLRMNEVI